MDENISLSDLEARRDQLLGSKTSNNQPIAAQNANNQPAQTAIAAEENPALTVNEIPEPDIIGTPDENLAEFNYGMATMLGTPVDILAVLPSLFGYEGTPVLGSKFNREALRSAGANLPEEGAMPKNFGGRFSRILGESILPMAILPITKFGQAAKQAPKQANKVKQMFSQAKEELIAKDREIAAVFLGALGGEAADKAFGYDAFGQTIGELAGALVPSIANIAKHLSVGAHAVKGASGLLGSQATPKRAAKRINTRASDVASAKTNLAETSILDLPPIARTDDPGLMALQKAAVTEDPKLLKRINDTFDENIDTARKLVLGDGSPQYTIDYLTGIKQKAVFKAQKNIENLGLDVDPVTASIALRGVIDDAYEGARNLETQIWGQLDEGVYVPQEPVVDTFKDILLERNVLADPKDIPSFLYEDIGRQTKKGFIAGKMKKDTSLDTLKTLRSKIQQERQVERALDVPNNTKLSLLGRINDTVLDTLAEVSPEYAEAVNYSRELNKSFTSGRVGRLLGFEKTGGRTVTPEGTFSYITSGGADKARQGIRQALSSSPEARPVMAESIKGLFNQSVMIDGALDVDKAKRFMSKQAIVLEEFPELQKGINDSIAQQTIVDEMLGRNFNSSVSTRIKNQSVMSLYLDNDADKAMNALLNAPRQGADGAIMRKMVEQVNYDDTGLALAGLKTAFGEHILEFASAGIEGLSGNKMLKMLKKHSASAKELLTKPEIARFKRIGEELRRINKTQAATSAQDGVINDNAAVVLSILVRIAGAKAGAAAAQGGAGLQAAAIGSKTAKDKIQAFTNDDAKTLLIKAVEDPKILADLLNRADTENLPEIINRFNSVLAGQGAIAATERPIPNEGTTLEALTKRQAALRDKQPKPQIIEIIGGNPDLAGKSYNDPKVIEYFKRLKQLEQKGIEQ